MYLLEYRAINRTIVEPELKIFYSIKEMDEWIEIMKNSIIIFDKYKLKEID